MSESPKYDIFNDIPYCSTMCLYNTWQYEPLKGYCSLLNKELNFYDWFIAECAEHYTTETMKND